MTVLATCLLGIMIGAVFSAEQALAEEAFWPQFRGGRLGGVCTARGLPDVWSPTQHIAWKTDIPGKGWSSPVVWGGRVFLTSVASDGKIPEARKGLYIQDLAGKVQPGTHRWLVHCLDAATGKVLWQKEVHQGIPAGPIHLKNTYASETPVTDGQRLCAYFGNLGLFCFDMDGKQLWSRKSENRSTTFGWGTGASPVLHQDRLYLVNDNEEKSYLLAVDVRSGQEVWRVERDEKSNWATPFVWENERRTEIVTSGAGKVRSYDLDGKLLWELGGLSSPAIPTPVAAHGLLYVTSGYVLSPRRPLFAIRPGASGDISLKPDQHHNDYIVWSQKQAGPYHPSPLVYGDFLYILYDRGFLACYDARTGKEVYGKQRLGPDAFTASPWAYDGKIFCLSEDGDTFAIQAGPHFKLLGKNCLNEMTLATPAPAGRRLILRTQGRVYGIGN